MKAYVILGMILLLQVSVLNSIDIYMIHLQLAWVGFVLAGYYFQPAHLPLLGTLFGWSLSTLSGDMSILATIFGLVIGIILSRVVQVPLWALGWVRGVAAATTAIIFELLIMLSVLGAEVIQYTQLLSLFVIVHLIAAYLAANLIIEPRYE